MRVWVCLRRYFQIRIQRFLAPSIAKFAKAPLHTLFLLGVLCALCARYSDFRLWLCRALLLVPQNLCGHVGRGLRDTPAEPSRIRLHIVAHAEAQAEIPNQKSATDRERDNKDADNARRLAIAHGSR